jgi:hypothetical protein
LTVHYAEAPEKHEDAVQRQRARQRFPEAQHSHSCDSNPNAAFETNLCPGTTKQRRDGTGTLTQNHPERSFTVAPLFSLDCQTFSLAEAIVLADNRL